jgi:hypothetical protein
MSQRMIALYKEASEFAYNVCKEEGRAGGPSDHIWHTLSTGRFAELIVRECLNKIENEAAQYAEPVWAVELINDIKEHFGVE